MPLSNLLEEAKQFEIQSYSKQEKLKDMKKTHIPFSGSPRKHPHDSEKIILLSDPYSTNNFYYEFKIKDISFVEELPNIVNLEEEVFTMVRIWVKKSSVGLRCTPFIVADLNI
ncbi:MAG: inorganic pyrophosphatase Ppa [Spirochaetota bacterium]|nr:inorganic pyrophosphatase Ppa [Spirochaetota bacterium]